MKARPNVILLTLDCLRPDHLGCYGYRGVETPNIDRLAENGVRCENAYCHGTNTWVSHASILTGLNPAGHGCRSIYSSISSNATVMAELFREAGYRTLGMPGTVLLNRTRGFHRGFTTYLFDELQEASRRRSVGRVSHLQSAESTFGRFADWLSAGGEPFFAWIHYFGIHHRGDPRVVQQMPGFSPFAQHYDGKVGYMDAHLIGPLLEELRGRHVLDRTLIVVTADHGDDLDAVHAGQSGHNEGADDGVVRIPLIFSAPGALPRGRTVQNCVRHVDVLPTVADLCGLRSPAGTDGISQLGLVQDSSPGTTESCTLYVDNSWRAYACLKYGAVWLHADWGKKATGGPDGQTGSGLRRRAALTRDYLWSMLPAAAGRRLSSLADRLRGGPGRRSRLMPDECAFHLRNRTGKVRTVRITRRTSCPLCPRCREPQRTDLLDLLADLLEGGNSDANAHSPEESREMEERLRELGYL